MFVRTPPPPSFGTHGRRPIPRDLPDVRIGAAMLPEGAREPDSKGTDGPRWRDRLGTSWDLKNAPTGVTYSDLRREFSLATGRPLPLVARLPDDPGRPFEPAPLASFHSPFGVEHGRGTST